MEPRNEHAARLKDPKAEHDSVRRVKGSGKAKIQGVKIPDTVSIVWYIIENDDSDDKLFAQSLRFPVSSWGKKGAKAKNWLKNNKIKYISFEPAKKEGQSMSDTLTQQDVMDKKSEHKREAIPLNALKFISGDPVQFVAAADDKGKHKFQMKANSGGIIQNHWCWGNFIIDMEGVEVARQNMPVLRDHFGDRIVGWTEEIKVDKNGIFAQGFFSQKTDDGKQAEDLAEEGFPWQASVYVPPLRIERIEEGEEVEVNGHTFRGPGTIFRKSVLREVSFCALGADENTSASMLSGRGEDIELDLDVIDISKKEIEMEMKDITLDKLKDERSDIVDQLKTELEAEIKEAAPDDKKQEFSEALDAGLTVERERMTSIFKKAADLGKPEIAVEYIEKGTPFETAHAEMAEARFKEVQNAAPESPGPDNEPETKGTLKPVNDSSLASASKENLEAHLKAEWDANLGNCKDQYSQFEYYVPVRTRQIRSAKKPVV